MVIREQNQSGWYWLADMLWIDIDAPGASERIRQSPTVPVANQATLELFSELFSKKATAEAKLELLKKAIQIL